MKDGEEDDYDDNSIPADWAEGEKFSVFSNGVKVDKNVTKMHELTNQVRCRKDARNGTENAKGKKKFENMLEDHKKLFCKKSHKKLSTTLKMMQWKTTNGVIDKGSGDLFSMVSKLSQP